MAETKPMRTEVHQPLTARAEALATPLDAGTPAEFTPEQLATPPSCPPLVGGFGEETPEVAEAREASEKRAPRLCGDLSKPQQREAQETPEQKRQRQVRERSEAEKRRTQERTRARV